MLDESVYKNRMAQVLKYIEDSDADFAFLTPAPSFQYLAGFEYQMRERLLALVIRKGENPTIVSPAFEMSDHSSHTWIEEFVPWAEDENPYSIVRELVGTNKVALLDDSTPLGVYWSLEKELEGFKDTASITPMIDDMRISKSDVEIELMKKAGHVIDDAVSKAFAKAQLGMTEIEVQQIVQQEIRQQGFVPTFAIVQFGENSALPHSSPGTRELRKGDVILMDCGCSLDGYNTDMTRVGVVGEPTEEVQRVHSTVLLAAETAIEKIKVGMACGAADGVARKIIDDAGYGEYFTHRLGHGIGLEVHEPPYVVRGSAQTLQSGMCHSVEPGIYLEGKFGVRIEDLVCIREDGPELLTFTSRDLILLDL
ncbi:MAG: M24 family metallopeptidase [Candidatus Thorarchaeota archaeon]